MDFKWYETAENFIRYATIHKLQRANHKIDPITTIDEYVYKRDWRIKANANQGYSVGGMILNTSGKIVANYWFNNVYPEDAGYAHRNGDIHLHDSDCLMGYCFSGDTKIRTKEYGNISLKELSEKVVTIPLRLLVKTLMGITWKFKPYLQEEQEARKTLMTC